MTDLPEGWARVALADLGTWKGGGTPSKARPDFWGGAIPWVSPKDMKTAKINGTVDGITPAAVAGSATSILSPGSVLVVTRSGILAHTLPVAINAVDVTLNQDLKALSPWPGLVSDYIRWALKGNERKILETCVKDGTTVHSIELPALMTFEIPLPPLPEQHRIVAKIEALFSELDAGQDSLTRAQAQLRLYRQSLLKAAFQGRLTADWRAANPDKLEPPETLLSRIRTERDARHKQALDDWQHALSIWRAGGEVGRKPAKPSLPEEVEPLGTSEIGDLPELPIGWTYIHLAHLGDLARGKSRHRPRNDPRLFGGAYPFIQTGDVKAAGRRVTNFSETYSDFGLSQSRLWPTGTLCITIAANIAETAFLGLDACFPDSVVGFTAFKGVVNPVFVELFVKAAREGIAAYAPATAQKNINLTTLEELVVPYCCPEEQQEISRRIDALFSSADAIEAEITTALAKITALRQSILKQAFSGRLVPQDPADEPASALLARLRDTAPAPRTRRKTQA